MDNKSELRAFARSPTQFILNGVIDYARRPVHRQGWVQTNRVRPAGTRPRDERGGVVVGQAHPRRVRAER